MRAQLLTPILLFANGISAAVHAFTTDPNEGPFWWTFTGTPIEEGLVFFAIVAKDPPSLPGLTRLYEAYNAGDGDYVYTNAAEYNAILFQQSAGSGWLEGVQDNLYVFGDNEPDTVPLYRFYNGNNHFFTTYYDEGPNAGYWFEWIACYVYLSPNNGAVPIYRWREDNWSSG